MSTGITHTAAHAIFNEIRARPYAVMQYANTRAENCYFKGTELLQRLGARGFTVRGQVGETYWDPALFPPDVLALASHDFKDAHFWCEVQLDGAWVKLDLSFDPGLARAGFVVSEFGDGELCFPITRTYTHQENVTYHTQWHDPAYAAAYFAANGPFLAALNAFFEKARAG